MRNGGDSGSHDASVAGVRTVMNPGQTVQIDWDKNA